MPSRPLTGYDLRYLNTDTPIPKLVAALQRRPQGVFCFYSPADEAEDYKAEVWRLERLTPGDVAVVVRQYVLWDETPSVGEFYDRLCAEVAAKWEDLTAESKAPVVSLIVNPTSPRSSFLDNQ